MHVNGITICSSKQGSTLKTDPNYLESVWLFCDAASVCFVRDEELMVHTHTHKVLKIMQNFTVIMKLSVNNWLDN